MALAPLQSRQAAANARGAPSFASSSRFSQSRASVAAACPYSSLLAQKKQQTLSSFSSPIRGGSLIAMSVGELVCWSRKGRAFANRERRERISCCTDRGRSIFFLPPTSSSSSSPLLVLSKKKKPSPAEAPSSHSAAIIDGKAIAATIRGEIAAGVKELVAATGGKAPGLAVVLVGARGDSETYVRSKVKACEEVGIESFASYLPEDVSQEELLKVRERGSIGEREREHVLSLLLGGEKEEEERENETKSTLYISARAPPTRDGFPVSFPLCTLGGYAGVRERNKNWRSRQKKRFPFFPPRRGASARAPDNIKRKKKRNKMSLSKRPPFLIIPDRSSPTSTPTPRSTASSCSSLFPNTSTRQRF